MNSRSRGTTEVGPTNDERSDMQTPTNYEINQEVDIIVAERSELGFKAIIEGKHWGMIFSSDVYRILIRKNH